MNTSADCKKPTKPPSGKGPAFFRLGAGPLLYLRNLNSPFKRNSPLFFYFHKSEVDNEN